jgi:hypothetical protein
MVRLVTPPRSTHDRRKMAFQAQAGERKRGGKWVWLLEIDRNADFNAAVDSLQHEWAHFVYWLTHEVDPDDHGPGWGVWYAKCYTVLDDEHQLMEKEEREARKR